MGEIMDTATAVIISQIPLWFVVLFAVLELYRLRKLVQKILKKRYL